MKITYAFANSEIVTIEVEDNLGNMLLELDRQEYNANHREIRRHASLEAFNLDDALFPSNTDIPAEYEAIEQLAAIDRAIGKLLPEQQRLIRQIFYEGEKPSDIARREGVDKSAISHRLDRALKKLKSFLD